VAAGGKKKKKEGKEWGTGALLAVTTPWCHSGGHGFTLGKRDEEEKKKERKI